MIELSADEARRAVLRAQGLLGTPDRRAGVDGMLRRLGAIQLDTISVLARSHELVPYARLGAVGRPAVEDAYWTSPARAFEYWSHAACVLPLESWPWFAFRRRHFASSRRWGERAPLTVRGEVRRRLHALGPLTSKELGGAKAGGEWWDRTPAKIAVEDLLDLGEVVVTRRRGWRRVYDLAERVIPPGLLSDDPDDEACWRALVRDAGRCLGVATRSDLADQHRLRGAQVDVVLPDSGLVPVRVRGWAEEAWADPDALAALDARGRHRTVLLSPFDSLIWHRPRTERLLASSTASRPTFPGRGGGTATSSCRCSRAVVSSGGWTRGGRAAPSWPGRSRWSPAPSGPWRRRCARRRRGWGATP